jgi:hypothetical protein
MRQEKERRREGEKERRREGEKERTMTEIEPRGMPVRHP